jgi:hypothetical protein
MQRLRLNSLLRNKDLLYKRCTSCSSNLLFNNKTNSFVINSNNFSSNWLVINLKIFSYILIPFFNQVLNQISLKKLKNLHFYSLKNVFIHQVGVRIRFLLCKESYFS